MEEFSKESSFVEPRSATGLYNFPVFPQSSLATRPIKRKLFSSPLVRSAMLASNVFYLIRFNRVLEKKYLIICYYKPREIALSSDFLSVERNDQ